MDRLMPSPFRLRGARVLAIALTTALAACATPAPGASGTGATPAAEGGTALPQPISGSGRIVGALHDGGFALSDTDGSPVDGATVFLDDLPGIKTTTSADGSFTLDGVPPGDHAIIGQKSTAKGDFKVRTTVTIAADQPIANLKTLVLRRTGAVFGKISLPSGDTTSLLGTDVFIAGSTLIAKSKDNGGYALGGVAEGTYKVTVSKAGYAPSTQTVEVTAGKPTQLDFTLAKADPNAKLANVTGVIAGPSGPLAGAVVSIKGANNASTVTDDAGRFTIANLGEGDYQAEIFRAGYTFQAVPVKVAITGSDAAAHTVDLGQIALQAEKAVAGAPIVVVVTPPPVDNPQALVAALAQAAASGAATPSGNGSQSSPTQTATPAAGPTPAPTPGEAPTPGATPVPVARATATPSPKPAADVPGTLDQEVAFPASDYQLVTFGKSSVNGDINKFAQTFAPSRAGMVTGVQFSLNVADGATPGDVNVSVYQPDSVGQPTGDALGSALIPAAKINRFGFNSPWTSAVFASPFAVSAGAKYVIVLACPTAEIGLVLNQSYSGGPALFSGTLQGQEVWQPVNVNGYSAAVFRVYLQ